MLERAAIENAAFEASVLLEELLGLTPGELLLKKPEQADEKQIADVMSAAERRIGGEPLQYIVGSWDFFGCRIIVGEDVFIPRPETELLIERLSMLALPEAPRIADLCSGSGCIAIAAAKQFPKAQVYSIELSDKALGYIKRNVELNGADNVTVLKRNVLKPPDPELVDLDVILSNPPYVPTDDIPALQREVQREPHMALDGGQDGLVFYRAITSGWKSALSPGGFLIFEIGDGQSGDVAELMRQDRYQNINICKDYAGIKRIVSAQK